jgi:tRNA U34 5-carboxymethylaminomethyl modifying enzyme MnmG/GidA
MINDPKDRKKLHRFIEKPTYKATTHYTAGISSTTKWDVQWALTK